MINIKKVILVSLTISLISYGIITKADNSSTTTLDAIHNKNNTPIIANGWFFNGKKPLPLLALSTDNGSSWSYPKSIYSDALPSVFLTGYLTGGASCHGDLCIAAGAGLYFDKNDRPLLALSKDGGNTWSYPKSIYSNATLPKPFYYGNLEDGGASCSGNTCIAGGFYHATKFRTMLNSRPLLTITRDGGATWSYFSDVSHLLPSPFGALEGTSCDGQLCIASGLFNNADSDVVKPLILSTQDGGKTWSCPASIYSSALPENFVRGALGGATCSGDTCMSGGSFDFFISDQDNGRLPLVALSKDRGTTWTYPATIYSKDALPKPFSFGSLEKVSCHGDMCIAAGSYYENIRESDLQRPLLAVSSDGGTTWAYPSSIYKTALPETFVTGAFNGASCSDNVCIAGGWFIAKDNLTYPLLAVSKDHGVTWSYPESIYTSALPKVAKYSGFNNVACHENLCVADGSYDIDNTGNHYPLLSQSTDGGVTWSYPESIYSTALPKSFVQGVLIGGVSVGAHSLSAISKFKKTVLVDY